MQIKHAKNPREAAFLALLIGSRSNQFVTESLEIWKEAASPATSDYHLAREIACGTLRMALALDYIGRQLTEKQQLQVKLKERLLLRTAIFQHVYLSRIPLYALTNETMEIAKKYCHKRFASFLNAVLRKLATVSIELPSQDTVFAMSIRYSYPSYFVQELIQHYGIEQAKAIMDIQNKAAPVMFRIRPGTSDPDLLPASGIELLANTLPPMAILRDSSLLPSISSSKSYYIQNATPAFIVYELAKKAKKPTRVLDLCASPGGKIIALHDLFPRAHLVANDLSEKKLALLSENFAKYGVTATLTCSRGEEYKTEEPFDLVIIDAPCSNSGVLHKRPEARWRISPQTMGEHEHLQLALIKRAKELIHEQGEIWYITCSILKRENKQLVEKAEQLFGLKLSMSKSFLPNPEGWDGGFGASLVLS